MRLMPPVPLGSLGLALALIALPRAEAQVIQLKTVPVAAGDQFLIFPSATLGMGGVTLALDDSLLDPFVNPAKGGRVGASHVFAHPTFYSVSENAGSAATLSAGSQFGGRRLFGGGMLALQELKGGDQFFGPIPLADFAILPPNTLRQRANANKYAFLTLGSRLPAGVALGASAFVTDLNGIDGVEHLYALSSRIEQAGHSEDLRLGITKDLAPGASLEALLLYQNFLMRHDVTYVDWVSVDSMRTWQPRERVEQNEDHTRTWGLHLGYRRPVGTTGWRAGGILTVNRKLHPTIPNYELVNIPRDPGYSTAFDFGLGIARVLGPTTFGMDIVYEPAWSSTWAEAAVRTPTADGDTIPAGGKTVENEFAFSNAFVRVGVSHVVGLASLQLGVQVRAYDYHLDQWNNVADDFRRQDEQWMEWVPSWGLALRFPGIEIRYLGRVTTGTGRPGVAWTGATLARAEIAALANDIVVPPGGPLTLQDVSVTTHQVSVAIPIR